LLPPIANKHFNEHEATLLRHILSSTTGDTGSASLALECDEEENYYSQRRNKPLAIHSTAYKHQTLAAHPTMMHKIKLINIIGNHDSIFS
jgi:hypothetical protein